MGSERSKIKSTEGFSLTQDVNCLTSLRGQFPSTLSTSTKPMADPHLIDAYHADTIIAFSIPVLGAM